MSPDTQSVGSSRLKWAGIILLILLLAGLGALAVFRLRREGYVVMITHGPKDADRIMLALTTAARLPKGDNHVWFAIDGGQLCKKGAAEKVTSPLFTKQGSAAKVIANLRAQGIAIHI
jgi:hypothetical protein